MQQTGLNQKETIEFLWKNRLKIIQSKKNYCFTTDSILLAEFILTKKNEKVIDLGTGCGIIPLMIYDQRKNNQIYGIEIQKELGVLAKQNAAMNQIEDQVHFIHGDIRELKKTFKSETFDVVTSNPPFISRGRGKTCLQTHQSLARHETGITIDEIVAIGSYLLKRGGRIYLIHRADSLIPVIMVLKKYNLEPKMLQFIYTKSNHHAKRFLIEARKDGGTELKIMQPKYLNKSAPE